MNHKQLCVALPVVFVFMASAAGLAFLSSAVWAQGTVSKPSGGNITNTTPEGAVRAFLIAGVTRDKEALRRVIVPIPEAQLAGLLEGNEPPAEAKKQMVAQLSGIAVKVLKPGEVAEMTGGRSVTVPKIADGKTLVYAQPVGMPLPLQLVKKNGKWLVDTKTILSARKAAGIARSAAKQP